MAKNIFNINKEKNKYIQKIREINEMANTNKEAFASATLDKSFKKNYVEINKNIKTITSIFNNGGSSRYLEDANAPGVIKSVSNFFTSLAGVPAFTKATNKAEDLINDTVKLNVEMNHSSIGTKSNASIPELQNKFNAFKQVENFVVFDTETLSGTGITGKQELDGMQEISLRHYMKTAEGAVEDESKRIETLIGIDAELKKHYEDVFINNFDKKGLQNNQKYQVIMTRLAKLGHADTKIEYNEALGTAVTKAFASSDSENLLSKENIKKGIEISFNIGDMQKRALTSAGVPTWQDSMLKMVNDINNNFSVGYNSTNFDFRKINQTAAKIWLDLNDTQKEHYSNLFGMSKGQIPTVNVSSNKYIDLRDFTRTAASISGKAALYDDNVKQLELLESTGLTALQQEALVKGHVSEGITTAAHTAGEDVNNLANLMVGMNGSQSVLEKSMDIINNNYEGSFSTINNNSILVANTPEYFNDFTRQGELNFTMDDFNKQIRLGNGKAIQADGSVKDLGKYGKNYGLKKNVAYRVGKMQKHSMSEEWVKQALNLNQDYAQGELFSATFHPIVNKTNTKGQNIDSPVTYIFNSQEEMNGFMSSHFDNVGELDKDGKPILRNDKHIKEKYKTRIVNKAGETVEKEASIENIIGMSTFKMQNDSAARMVRDYDIDKAKKFIDLDNELEERGIKTLEDKQAFLSSATSKEIKSAEVDNIKKMVKNSLGYKSGAKKEKYLWESTLNNYISAYPFMQSQKQMMIKAMETVEEYSNPNNHSRQAMYKTLMQGIIQDADEAFGTNGVSIPMFEKDRNFFEFNMPAGYFNNGKGTMAEVGDNVFKVNLAPGKEYSLIKSLLSKRRGKFTKDNKLLQETYGRQELIDFMKTTNSMPEYKGMFDGLLKSSEQNEVQGEIEKLKYEKANLTDNHFDRINGLIEDEINNHPEIGGLRDNLTGLQRRKKELLKDLNKGKLSEATQTLGSVNAEFEKLIFTQEEWNSKTAKEKQNIKAKQNNLRTKREIELDYFSQRKENIHELEEINKEIDNTYKGLVGSLDSNRENNRKVFVNQYQDAKKELQEKINALAKKEVDSNGLYKNHINVDILGEKMLQAMSDFRKENPGAGYEKEISGEIVTKSYPNAKRIDDDFISKSIKKHLDDVPNIITIDNEKPIENVVADLVDDVLMPKLFKDGKMEKATINEIVDHAANVFGYNQDQIKLLKNNLELHRQDHIEGIKKLVAGITNSGGEISYNTQTEDIFMHMDGDIYNLDQIPKTKYHNGVLFNQSGVSRVGAAIDFNVEEAIRGGMLHKEDVRATSVLHDPYNQLRYMESNAKRAMNRGEKAADIILRDISNMASEVREIPAIYSMTAKDTLNSTRAQTSKFLKAIPYIQDEIKSYAGWLDPEFAEIMEKNSEAIKNGVVTSEVLEAYAKNKQDVIKIATGVGAGSKNNRETVTDFVISQINNYGKDSIISQGDTLLGTYNPIALLGFDDNSRPPVSAIDNMLYSKKSIDEKISKSKKLKGRLKYENKIVSEANKELREIEHVGKAVDGFMFNHASIAEKDFKETVYQKYLTLMNDKTLSAEDKKRIKKVYSKIKGLNLTEQGRILDGYIADALLDKTETQYIGIEKNFIFDKDVTSKQMRDRVSNAMPEIEMHDGKITFKSGARTFVKRDDPLLAVKGYGNSISTIGVKGDAGLFGFNYYSIGTKLKVEDEEIEKLLNKHKDEILDEGKIDYVKARKILSNTFDGKFYVENTFIKGYNKSTTEAAEKAMYMATLSGAGTIDGKVSGILKEANLEKYNGKILGTNFIDEVLAPAYIKKNGAEKWKTAKKLIEKEKFATANFMRSIFGETSSIAVDNVKKHGNAGIATKQFIYALSDAIKSKEKLTDEGALKKTVKVLNDKKVFHNYELDYDEKLKKIIDKGGHGPAQNIWLDKNRITDIAKNYEIDERSFIKNSKGKIIGIKNKAMTAFNENFSAESRSNNNIQGYKEELKNKKELMKNAPAEEKAQLSEEILNIKNKINVAAKNDKKMKIANREVNMFGLQTYSPRGMERAKKLLGGPTYNKLYSGLTDRNGKLLEDANDKKVYEGFINNVKEKAVKQMRNDNVMEELHSAAEATSYNKNPLNKDMDTLVKKGFEVEKLEDLVTPIGENTEFIKDLPNRSVGRNVLIETGLSGRNAYVAMPRNNIQVSGDTVANNKIQKKLRELQLVKQRLVDGKKGDPDVLRNGVTVKKLESNVISKIDELRSSIVEQTKDTLKKYDEVKIGNYSYEDASGAFIDTDDLKHAKETGIWTGEKSYDMLSKSEFQGKKIGQWASEGVHLDASWHGMQYFDNLGVFKEDTLKKYNMTKEQMVDHLSTKGMYGIETRTPVIKVKASTINRQFLDPNLNDGVSKTIGQQVLGRNQDHDGDKIINSVLEFDGKTSLDSDILKEDIPEFKELERATAYLATNSNPEMHKKAVEIYDKKDPGMSRGNTYAEVLGSEKVNTNAEGKIMPTPVSQEDSYIRLEHQKRYEEMRHNAINEVGEEAWEQKNPLKKSEAIYDQIAKLDKSKADTYRGSTRFMENLQRAESATESKTAGKAAIGFINTPLYELRLLADGEGFSSVERNYIQAAADISEQKIISKKHSTDYAISLTESFRANVSKLMRGEQEGVQGLHKLIDIHAEDIIDTVKTHTTIDTTDLNDEDIINNVKSTFSKMHRTILDDPNMSVRMNSRLASKRITEGNMKMIFNNAEENGPSLVGHAMAVLGKEQGGNSKVTPLLEDVEIKNTGKKVTGAIAEEIEEMASHSGGSAIAKAALGLAAAVMTTGYIGGNPTAPADNQAEQMDKYDSLQDKDLGIQQMQQGAGQGYVININAQSSKGQEHAMQAIQQAMQSAVPTNVNVAMNIKDKTSNISSRLVDNLLNGAL